MKSGTPETLNIPSVSVIITTYGDSSVLPRAISSVMEEGYKNFELIVVDDNDPSSSERSATEVVMKAYIADDRVIYVKHSKNMNGSAARNTGLSYACGEYVTFLDNDDVMLEGRISEAISCLEANSQTDGFFCGVAVTDRSGFVNRIVSVVDSDLSQRGVFLNENLIGTGSNLFFRRQICDELGMFDTRFKRNQDVEYLIRFFKNHAAIASPKVLLVKGSSGTDNTPDYYLLKQTKKQLYSIFQEDFDRLLPKEQEDSREKTAVLLWGSALLGGDSAAIKDARREVFSYLSPVHACIVMLQAKAKRCMPKIYERLRLTVLKKRQKAICNLIGAEVYEDLLTAIGR